MASMMDNDYDSDTSDEDFVPGVADSDDEVVSDVVEEDENEEDVDGDKKSSKKKKSKSKKKKKGNPLLAGLEESKKEEEEDEDEEKSTNVEEDESKVNDLWADFLADTEEKPPPPPKPKSNSWAALLGNKKSSSSTSNSKKDDISKAAKEKVPKSVVVPPKSDTVKITKVFEFAGEEVRIEKEVASNSAEAAQALLEKSMKSDSTKQDAETAKSAPGGLKRPGGLSSVLGLLDNKKQKLSTLEKTKLDWDSYKSSEDIVEELEMHKKSKHGYLEKKEFLQRADIRQFEIERSMRMGSKRSNR